MGNYICSNTYKLYPKFSEGYKLCIDYIKTVQIMYKLYQNYMIMYYLCINYIKII